MSVENELTDAARSPLRQNEILDAIIWVDPSELRVWRTKKAGELWAWSENMEGICIPLSTKRHMQTSLLHQWREGLFEATADEAAQCALDDQAVGLDVAPIIEAWLNGLVGREGL